MPSSTRLLLVLPLLTVALIGTGCARSERMRTFTLGDAGSATGTDSASADAAVPAASASTSAEWAGRPGVTKYMPIAGVSDIHFDFDRSDLRTDAVGILDRNAAWMLEHKNYLVLVEGHADERGTPEYNVALGDKRAKSAVNYLVSKGIAASRFTVVSYGAERPLCRESNDGCWARNRRAAFLVKAE